MNKIYLQLGSNMGNSLEKLAEARKGISKQIGKIKRESQIYQTAAWGKSDQPDFLNQVIMVETDLAAPDTIQTLLSIEKTMGRIRTLKNAPRTIDIDILFFNKETITQPDLVVPHQQIPNRRFVLIPLNELAANFIHPVLNKTIHQLLRDCKDKLAVKKI